MRGVAIAIAVAAAPAARASVALALDVPELVLRADRVVLGEVLSVRCEWDDAHRTILSKISVAVRETWKGNARARLSLVQIGGELDGLVTRVPGQSTFVPGERAVLFLEGTDQASSVIGLGQGKRPLRFDRARRAWMVEPGDRSAAVQIDGAGHLAPAPPQPALSLAAMRRQVRAVATRGRTR